MTTIEHLRSLLAKATPRPWNLRETVHGMPELGRTIILFGDEFTGTNFFQTKSEGDAELIAALVNAAPALLDVVEAACAWVDGHCSHDVKERIALRVAVDAIRAQEGK